MNKELQKSEVANDEGLIDMINRHWDTYAASAFLAYACSGGGVTTMIYRDAVSGYCSWGVDWPNSEVERLVEEYDPNKELIFVIQRHTGELSCFRMPTPSDRLQPLEAYITLLRTLAESDCAPLPQLLDYVMEPIPFLIPSAPEDSSRRAR
jgi:hypothetical protein